MPTATLKSFHATASAPAPRNRVAEPEQQSVCLVESLLRVLEDHQLDGDRWLRMQTASLIRDDIAAIRGASLGR